ncbi:MAG: MerR family transcriptional regulator [Bacilli bacterium]|nr:MerR family transcriptional regulator [Bacilli bacterium]
MSDSIRRNLALFPIGIVQKLTDLSARQIRYYEQHKLIEPLRTEGNQRLFSFNDVERLLEIKRLIDQGLNISGIKKVLGTAEEAAESSALQTETVDEHAEDRLTVKDLSEEELHDLLKKELLTQAGRSGLQNTLIAGQLSRFYQ